MRRLAPLLIATVALATVLVVTPSGAAAAHWRWTITGGAAHSGSGNRLIGHVTIENTGNERSPRVTGELRMASEEAGFRRPAMPLILPLAPGESVRLRFHPKAPRTYPHARWRISFCVAISECRHLGRVVIGGRPPVGSTAPGGPTPSGSGGGSGSGSGAGGSTPTGTPSAPAPAPASTVPTDSIPYQAGKPFAHSGSGVGYWAYVPSSYDATNGTPSTLFVWLHGCGGEAGGDIWNVDPEAGGEGRQDWLTLALAGREEPGDECWVPGADTTSVLAAIADFESHFNVDRRRVILGGYSSGGDLAYRTAYEHAALFAGLLIENSAPFRDTGLTPGQAIGDATWKFPVVQLAHTGDETYGIEEVRPEIATLKGAGFPVTLIERPGRHYDSHTDADLRSLLLPHIDDGWLAP